MKERKDIAPTKSASGINSEPEVHARFLLHRVLWTNFALGQSSSLSKEVLYYIVCNLVLSESSSLSFCLMRIIGYLSL